MKSAVHISRDTALIAIVERLLTGYCRTIPLGNIRSGVDYIYSLIPDLLIIDLTANDPATVEALNTIKTDPIFTHLPTLALIDDALPLPRWDDVMLEDYVWKSQIERDLRARAELCVARAERVVEVNPLTRLPGNISINRAIQAFIDRDEPFGVGYADLDNFKPFNDHYGFARGDEVIKMTGRLILNIVKNRQPQGSFIGHIGGDDFIFIMDAEAIEDAAAEDTLHLRPHHHHVLRRIGENGGHRGPGQAGQQQVFPGDDHVHRHHDQRLPPVLALRRDD